MRNKFIISLAIFSMLVACTNEANKDSSDKNSSQTEEVKAETKVEKKQAIASEKAFLKVLYEQKVNNNEMQAYMVGLGAIDSKEKQDQIKEKIKTLNENLKKSYESLDITDADIKKYLATNEELLVVQGKLETEGKKLYELIQKEKRDLKPEEMKTFDELQDELLKITNELTSQKVLIDERFAAEAEGITKEFYQIENLLNLEYKKAFEIDKKLADDKTIKNEDAYNKKFIKEIVLVDKDISKQLKALELTDESIKAYRDAVLLTLDNKVAILQKDEQMQKEWKKSKKLSKSNQALMDKRVELNSKVSKEMLQVLETLTK